MNNYSISLPSYSIGDNVYSKIEDICLPYGKKAVAIGGEKAINSIKEILINSIKDTEIEIIDFILYGTDATYDNVQKLIDNKVIKNADMIFAIGGGKAIDTCKAYSHKTKKPVFTFPTIASTCAATTAVSIMYNNDGTFKEPYFHTAPPNHAFIYTPVIAKAPIKYIWAGIGDTYAKYFEAEMSSRNEALTHYHQLGVTVSRDCVFPVLTYGEKAINEIKSNVFVSSSIEQIILSIIVTTGIASILLTAEHIVDYNSGLAHAVFYSLTAWEHIEKNHLHGEVVSLGVLILLLVDNNSEMFKKMFDFNKSIGLPTSIKDIEMTNDDIKRLTGLIVSMKDIEHSPYEITQEMVKIAFDTLGKYN